MATVTWAGVGLEPLTQLAQRFHEVLDAAGLLPLVRSLLQGAEQLDKVRRVHPSRAKGDGGARFCTARSVA